MPDPLYAAQSLALVQPTNAQPVPTYNQTNVGIPARANPYGEQIVQTVGMQSLAADGAQYVATNPTLGTAITQHILAAFDATKPSFLIRNNDPQALKIITLQRLALTYLVVPASGTAGHLAVVIDTGTRYSSGGSALTPVANSGSQTSIAQVYAGAVTASAASAAARLVGRAQWSSVIPVAGDTALMAFGFQSNGAGNIAGTSARVVIANLPAIVLKPGEQALVYAWYPSNSVTAATCELQAEWSER